MSGTSGWRVSVRPVQRSLLLGGAEGRLVGGTGVQSGIYIGIALGTFSLNGSRESTKLSSWRPFAVLAPEKGGDAGYWCLYIYIYIVPKKITYRNPDGSRREICSRTVKAPGVAGRVDRNEEACAPVTLLLFLPLVRPPLYPTPGELPRRPPTSWQ